jgi:PPM family protein phosphatase
MPLIFKTCALTDLGLQREGNEDAALVSASIIAVADGMGGHAGGEVASKIAIKALADLIPIVSDKNIDSDSKEDLLLNLPFEIDEQISERSKSEPELSGMGTTLTALYLAEKTVHLLHIGDSRCYAISSGKLKQLSYDHTVMQELIDQGRLTQDEVASHPQRSLLTQALMGDSGIEPILLVHEVKVGDQFLLCSDGLTGFLSDLEISKLIKKHEGDELLAKLLEATKAKGAPDNVTILIAEVVDAIDDGLINLIGAANELN